MEIAWSLAWHTQPIDCGVSIVHSIRTDGAKSETSKRDRASASGKAQTLLPGKPRKLCKADPGAWGNVKASYPYTPLCTFTASISCTRGFAPIFVNSSLCFTMRLTASPDTGDGLIKTKRTRVVSNQSKYGCFTCRYCYEDLYIALSLTRYH